MPKWGSFLSLNTAVKVGAGAAAGYFGSSYTGSAEDLTKAEVREERREEREKRLNFEVQQRSNELDKREQSLKTQEEALLKREAALREERLAMQSMQASTVAVTEETAGAVAAKTVQIVEEPTDLKIEQHKTVVATEKPTEYVPKRPAVFDGRGNAPVVTNKSSTNGAEPQLLYFNDPSFATDRVPSTDGRDGLRRPLLSPTDPNARRFANLRPQHVVSVKATPGEVVVREGRAGTLSSSPEARFGTASDTSGAGAAKMDKKGDAMVVTLYGPSPKPPFDGKNAVSEAERNAFDKEKQLFARQKEGFKRKKTEKEKELADKERALEDREAGLELRGNAADLFNFEDRRMITSAVRVNIPSDAKKTDEPFAIRKNSENFYDVEEEFAEEDGKAKAYKISAQKPGFFSRTFRWFGGLFGNNKGNEEAKKPVKVWRADRFATGAIGGSREKPAASEEGNSDDEYEDALSKEEAELRYGSFGGSGSGGKNVSEMQRAVTFNVQSGSVKSKEANKVQHTNSLLVNGDEQRKSDAAAAYEIDAREGLAVIPEGRHPGEKENPIKRNATLTITAKPKEKLLWEPRDDISVNAKEKQLSKSVYTDEFSAGEGEQKEKTYTISKGDQFMISTTKELEKLKESLREIKETLKQQETKTVQNDDKAKMLDAERKRLEGALEKQIAAWNATKQNLEMLLKEERENWQIPAQEARDMQRQVLLLKSENERLEKRVRHLKEDNDVKMLDYEVLVENLTGAKKKTEKEKEEIREKLSRTEDRLAWTEREKDMLKAKLRFEKLQMQSQQTVRAVGTKPKTETKDTSTPKLRPPNKATKREVVLEEVKSDRFTTNRKIILKQESGTAMAVPKFKISKTETVAAEAKKVEKRDIATEMEKPALMVVKQVPDLTQAKPKAALFIEKKDSIEMLPKEKAPYVTEMQNEESMTIWAQSKPENEVQTVDKFLITQKEKPENIRMSVGEIVLEAPKKPENVAEVVSEIELKVVGTKPETAAVGTQTPKLRPPNKKKTAVLPVENSSFDLKATKREVVSEIVEGARFRMDRKPIPTQKESGTEMEEPEKRDFGMEPVKPELEEESLPYLTVEPKPKAALKVEKGEKFTMLPKEKTPYSLEKQNGDDMTILAQPKPENEVQTVDKFLITQKEKPENIRMSVGEIVLEAPKKPENVAEVVSEIELKAEPKTFGKLEKGSAVSEAIGDDLKLREAKKEIGEAEKKIEELESELRKLKTQSFISEIEKEDELKWDEEAEKQMECKRDEFADSGKEHV